MTSWNSLNWTKALSSKKAWENRSLVEFAAWLSCHSAAFLEQFDAVPEASLQGYWQASRGRWMGWMQTLKQYHAAAEYANSVEWVTLWKHTRGVAAEVLSSEPITRLWGSLLAIGESAHQRSDSEPVTRCVLSNHTTAVDYVMNLLQCAPRVPQNEAAELKHLHHHSRRWCDLLLAPLIDHHAAEPFAINPQRSAEFYAAYFTSETRPEVFWSLFGTSVQLFFQRYSLQTAPSSDANRAIVRSILKSLPSDPLRPEPAALTHGLCSSPRNGRGRLDGLV
jgi:hypothetical protein